MAKEDTLEKFRKEWNKRPELRDLNNYVVIKCATAWKELGENLKVDKNLLKIIGKDNPHSCENCCSKMLSEWLDLTPEASWGILLDAMQNLNLSTDITEDLHTSSLADTYVQPATKYLCENYIKSRFYYTPDDWPPYHIKHYTTLALIHHKGRHVNTEVISITEGLVTKGNLSKHQPASSNISYHSKDISELFPTNLESSYFLLIEGAPGIGKTVLSKEIAYQWAENKLLNYKKLTFLLFLRDPNLKHLSSLESLIEYLVESTEIASGLTRYLSHNKGKGLIIIFDGYDEMSEEDRNNSVIAKIISRNLLPECDLVITSRPSASLYLRDVANCRVEVLGFTEEDRLDYIQHALKGLDDKIKALQFYLQSNSTINALCYVPLNMTILLCLFEEIKYLPDNTWDVANIGLPSTQTEMYEKFTLMTIIRFIYIKKILLIGNNTLIAQNPTNEQISLSIQLELSLTVCKLWNFVSSIESFQRMVNPLSSVVELDILGSNFNVQEAITKKIKNFKKE